MKNRKILGNGLLLLTALVWGTAFVFQRVGMEKIEPITFSAARMALAAVMVGAVAYLTRRKKKYFATTDNADEREKDASKSPNTDERVIASSKIRTADEQKEYNKNKLKLTLIKKN